MNWLRVTDAAEWISPLFTTLYLLTRVLLHLYARRHRHAGRAVSGRGDQPTFLILFGALLVILGYELPQLRVSVVAVTGMLLMAAALGLRVEALRQLAQFYSEAIVIFENHQVVSTGVYRILRHPLHLSLMIEAGGLAMLSQSMVAVPFLCAVLIVAMWRNVREERLLLQSLGSDYARYVTGPAWDVIDMLPTTWRPSRGCSSQGAR